MNFSVIPRRSFTPSSASQVFLPLCTFQTLSKWSWLRPSPVNLMSDRPLPISLPPTAVLR